MADGVEDRIAALEAAVEDLRAENAAIAIMVRHLMEVNGGQRDSQRGDDPRAGGGNNVPLPLGEHGVSDSVKSLHEPTRVVEVFMAGDVEHAKQVLRRFCMETPCCVTVTPTTYIYKGGEESGFVVGFRNYPRFPSDSYSLRQLAAEAAERLQDQLGQRSFMAVDHGGMTTWSTKDE